MTRGDLFGPSDPAIVAVDLATGEARRLLSGHASVGPDGSRMVVDGVPVTGARPDGSTGEPQLGLNPITIDARDEWVYYGALHGKALYRVRTADLLDRKLGAAELGARVERAGAKGVSDGITIDAGGNVYVTDVEQHAIGVLRPGGSYELYLKDAALQWPDGFGSGPDGYIYVTINQLNRMPQLRGGKGEAQAPYLLARFRSIAGSVVGR